jgi:hypothetical protein
MQLLAIILKKFGINSRAVDCFLWLEYCGIIKKPLIRGAWQLFIYLFIIYFREVFIIIMTDPLIAGTQLSNSICPDDAKLWETLFIAADRINPDFSSRLMYMRNSGCILVPHKKFGYVIKPLPGNTVYDQEKCCLNDFVPELIKLLSALKNMGL